MKFKINLETVNKDKLLNFHEFIGRKFNLYHCTEANTFILDKYKLEALEDESDGYRSMLSHVQVLDDNFISKEGAYLATVEVVEEEDTNCDFSGYYIRDVNTGHHWYKIGTNNHDYYYPLFEFYYNPQH